MTFIWLCVIIYAEFDVFSDNRRRRYILGLFNKYVNKKKTDIDSIVGQRCFVIDKVDNYAGCGQVRVNRQYWAARASSDEDVYEEE